MNQRIFRSATLLVVAVCCLLMFETVASACPTCKDAIASTDDPNQASVARAYGWSILFMMSMPFLILTFLGTYVYLLIRSNQRKLASVRSVDRQLAEAVS